MRYLFLNEKFYKEHNRKDYPEILTKSDRPYIMIEVKINGFTFGIPLRSAISHSHVLWTNKIGHCGADYSKAVLIPDETYIDARKPFIRQDEFDALKGKEYLLQTGFKKYIKKYKKALERIHIRENKSLCNCSTLQYYHSQIGIIDNLNRANEEVAATKEKDIETFIKENKLDYIREVKDNIVEISVIKNKIR